MKVALAQNVAQNSAGGEAMARKPKPWWRADRKGYYASVRGVVHRLGTNLKDANSRLKELLEEKPVQALPVSGRLVVEIFDNFLTWTEENRSAKTFRGYKDFCESFNAKFRRLPLDEMSTAHVTAWLKGQKSWNSTTKRAAITCLMRAFNWAVKNDGLTRNPIAGMEKPTAKSRVSLVTPEEFESILKHVKDEAFKELLIVSFDTGARPQEIKALEARHVDIEKHRADFPTDEAKGGKAPRIVYFPTDRAMAIIKRRIEDRPEGKLFLNRRGRPWTAAAVKCRFDRLEEKTGRRFRQYDFRHGWITRKLVAGVDSHLVAKLAGHSDLKMLHKVYSHVADDYRFMLEAAKKEAPKTPDGEAAGD